MVVDELLFTCALTLTLTAPARSHAHSAKRKSSSCTDVDDEQARARRRPEDVGCERAVFTSLHGERGRARCMGEHARCM